MIKTRNKGIYGTGHRIPVLVSCPDFTQEELSLVLAGLHSIQQDCTKEELELVGDVIEQTSKSFIIEHPYDKAIESFNTLRHTSIRYWGKFPFKISTGEFTLALNSIADTYLGEKTEILWSYSDMGDLIRSSGIHSIEEYRAFIIKLLSQQTEVVLSYLYGTGEAPSKVALTSCTNKDINEKITEWICPVTRSIFKEKKTKSGDVNLVVDRKELRDLFNTIIAGLDYSRKLNAPPEMFRGTRWG
jgi:hypothetical protein